MAVFAATAVVAAVVAVPGTPAQAVTDTSAPTLSSVTPVSTTVLAGDPVVLTFVGHDDVGINSVVATFQSGAGVSLNVMSIGGEASPTNPIGPITGVVPLGAASGTYTLTYLSVADEAQNYTTYLQGSAVSTPSGTPALIDLSAVKVTVVQPGTTDITAPALTAFSMIDQGARRPGEFVTWNFAVSDAMSSITEVGVTVKGPGAQPNSAVRGGGILTAGKLSMWMPLDEPLGHWTVESVGVTDSSGNIRVYGPDGIGIQSGRPSVTGPSFVGMGFDLVAGDFRFDPIRVLDERPDATVATSVSSSLVAPGTAVTVRGSVRYVGHVVPFPSVAVYAETATGTTLLGVTRGTAAGTFARLVVPTKPTVYRVLFLGSDRGGSAVPATIGARIGVRTALAQKLVVASRTISVRAGHRGALVVTLSPKRAGVLVYLQRQAGSSWRNVTSTRTTSRGTVALTVARPSTPTVYRWVAVYDGHYLAATSSTVTVRRG
jgi:hypothetical protein